MGAGAKNKSGGSTSASKAEPSLTEGSKKTSANPEGGGDSLSPRSGRDGTRLIGGHFDKAVARQLRLLAAEEDTTIQALLEEALNLLFIQKGKGPIIGSSAHNPEHKPDSD